jgi:hypothetical protein
MTIDTTPNNRSQKQHMTIDPLPQPNSPDDTLVFKVSGLGVLSYMKDGTVKVYTWDKVQQRWEYLPPHHSHYIEHILRYHYKDWFGIVE